MENKYLVNSDDLTSVANAIRAKGETSAQLAFPSGFVSAIEGIKTGTELNFEVVGGKTPPSNPKENTIWINTSTPISRWFIGSTSNIQASPVDGMVMIITTNSSNLSFNALKDGFLFVNPVMAGQFKLNSWDFVDFKIYKEGSWQGYYPDGALYYHGNEVASLTGGWVVSNRTYDCAAGAYTKHSDRIELRTTGESTSIRAYTNNRISLNGIDKIGFRVVDSTLFSGNGVFTLILTEYPDAPNEWTRYVNISGETGYYQMDVSDLNGEYFVSIEIRQNGSGNTGMIAFDEVMLE